MRGKLTFLAALVTMLLFGTTACGDDDGEADQQAGAGSEVTELTVAIPYPSAIAHYPLYVAQARGYFEEEGISVDVQVLDGSGPVLQALESGQAHAAIPSMGPFMQAVHRGADLVGVYQLYQANIFSIQTLADSDVQSLADLEGQTLGVGALDGGETPFAKAVLSEAAGLEEGDYKILPVGDGGTAAVALEGGDVAAYAAAFPDVAIMKLRGLDLRELLPADFKDFSDGNFIFDAKFVEQNPEVIEGFGRGLAKATVWGRGNPEGTLEICGEAFPEEVEDEEFAAALLSEVQSLFVRPGAEQDHMWGFAYMDAVERYMNFLVQQGELDEPIDLSVILNDFVEEYNNFDRDDL